MAYQEGGGILMHNNHIQPTCKSYASLCLCGSAGCEALGQEEF